MDVFLFSTDPWLREKIKDPELFKIFRYGMVDGITAARKINSMSLEGVLEFNKFLGQKREKQILRDSQETEPEV